MNPLVYIDRLLNGLTMYKLLAFGLTILSLLALGFSAIDVLSLPFFALLISLLLATSVCFIANEAIGRLWGAPRSSESYLITGLILFFLLPPATTPGRAAGIIAAAVLAMASKYFIALHRKHLFNPAAFGAVVVGLLGLTHAFWWVGSGAMLPFTLTFGFLILRKLHRFVLFTSFALTSLIITIIMASIHGTDVSTLIRQLIISSPLIFLGTVMLTEPSTMPPKVHQHIIYGAIVGALSAAQAKMLGLNITPELSLLIGNLYAWIVGPKYKWQLRLKEIRQLSPRVYDIVFTPERPLTFQPGQYMEWTLEHPKADVRGNRRSFSIASSPTEPEVHLGIKTYQPSSTFKQALLAMKPGQTILAGPVGGNFTLPNDPTKKLVLVAGGIGITPFRSMLQYLIDNNQQRDITLIYSVSDAAEISYNEIVTAATRQFGLVFIPVLSGTVPATWNGETGAVTPELLKQKLPDYKNSIFYLSGPNAMVQQYRHDLRKLKVPNKQIRTDYFAGY